MSRTDAVFAPVFEAHGQQRSRVSLAPTIGKHREGQDLPFIDDASGQDVPRDGLAGYDPSLSVWLGQRFFEHLFRPTGGSACLFDVDQSAQIVETGSADAQGF